jgi:hypothetical protein
VVETFPSNRADDPLGVRVLPRGTRSGHLVDSHSGRRWSDPREGVITIANGIARDFVPWERVHEDSARASVSGYRWRAHCRGLYHTPIAA